MRASYRLPSSVFPPVFARIRCCSRLSEAAELLQQLDLIPVRIFDEEETGDLLVVFVELDDLARLKTLCLRTAVLRVEVVHDESDMAVASPRL